MKEYYMLYDVQVLHQRYLTENKILQLCNYNIYLHITDSFYNKSTRLYIKHRNMCYEENEIE